MKRRRLIIALTVLMGVGALSAWMWTHRHDSRLVGRWLVTEDTPATAEQLQAAADRTKSLPKIVWVLHRDGSGVFSDQQMRGGRLRSYGSEVRWWTNGDRLRIKWEMTPSGWESIKESAEDLYCVLSGEPPRNPAFEIGYANETSDLIRLEPRDLPSNQPMYVLYLTRLKEDEP